MGRFRDNGLPADAYVALVALPANYAESVLKALHGAAIAGYVHLSDTAQPQLFVDVAKQSAAADLIHTGFPEVSSALDPQPPSSAPSSAEKTGDPLWDDLVARYYEPTGSGGAEGSWPTAENLDPDETTDPPSNGETDSDSSDDRSVSFLLIRRRYSPSEDSSEDPASTGTSNQPESANTDDEDDHYVPPPAPPLPQGDGISRLAWGGLLGAPTLWVLMMLLGQTVPSWMALLLVVWFIGGFIVLVARMRDDRPPGDSGPDNGAVV